VNTGVQNDTVFTGHEPCRLSVCTEPISAARSCSVIDVGEENVDWLSAADAGDDERRHDDGDDRVI